MKLDNKPYVMNEIVLTDKELIQAYQDFEKKFRSVAETDNIKKVFHKNLAHSGLTVQITLLDLGILK